MELAPRAASLEEGAWEGAWMERGTPEMLVGSWVVSTLWTSPGSTLNLALLGQPCRSVRPGLVLGRGFPAGRRLSGATRPRC